MVAYRVKLTPDDNDTLLVTCPKIPMVTTFGRTREEALAHAVDAIETALASMIADDEPIPAPDGGDHLRADETVLRLPASTALKLQLVFALKAAGITRAELARRLGWNRESVDRLFRLDHRSRLEQLEAAFGALGRTVDVVVRSAA